MICFCDSMHNFPVKTLKMPKVIAYGISCI